MQALHSFQQDPFRAMVLEYTAISLFLWFSGFPLNTDQMSLGTQQAFNRPAWWKDLQWENQDLKLPIDSLNSIHIWESNPEVTCNQILTAQKVRQSSLYPKLT